MSRFGPDPRSFFNTVYEDIPPWEIGKPQPAMAAMLAKFPPMGPVLDAGCGSGDLSLYLATLGYEVLGIDFVETAILQAREKIKSLPDEAASRIEFLVADALRPSRLRRVFGAVVDSGFYHLFDMDECRDYAEELARSIRPGGHLYLHEFAVEFPVASMPRRVCEEELRTLFTPNRGWSVKEVQSTEFLSRVAPPVPAICACLERLPE